MSHASPSTRDTAAVSHGETMAGAIDVTAAVGGDGKTPSPQRGRVRLDRGASVDRYVVLARLGAGGMGEVFAVYDPELDRKVALKLLHPRLTADDDPRGAREASARLVREAQALARLNHPNIVTVHDVGEHQGAVWLAMEYVDGETLSAWSQQRRRSWREVLDVLTPAARGLSAAHAAGLVHRDIKPDNLMIGRDGRVRVMDLGLARALGPEAPEGPDARTTTAPDRPGLSAQVTRAGAVLGTPAYMSPEQFEGAPVDARADVFSFCVTLWEALMGERPFAGDTPIELAVSVVAGKVRPVPRAARDVPGWLRQVCLRGLARDPSRRFPSMDALLRALARGQARARVRGWLVGVAAVAALGAGAALVRSREHAGRIAACAEAGASIDAVWNDEARARVKDGILASGVSYASSTAEKVVPFLDRQAEAWREQRTRACLAGEVEATLDAEQLDRALWCLDERRMELVALLAELSHADDLVVQGAVTAAAGLPPVSPCTDAQVLAALPSPPAIDVRERADVARRTLSQVRALFAAGKYPLGLERARVALAEAEALGWPPMIAAARQGEGNLLEKTGDYAAAEAADVSAYMEAARLRVWGVAASAAVELVYTVGYKQARHAEGRLWAGHAEVAIALAGDPLGLREALRLNQLGLVQLDSGAFAEAKALHERALAIREKALGPDHLIVAGSLNNLALIYQRTGANAEAMALYRRALAIRERALSPEHPLVAMTVNNVAYVHISMGAYAEARALLEEALALLERALGPEHPDLVNSLINLANIEYTAGNYAGTRALFERALAIQEKAFGPEHPQVAGALNNLAVVTMSMGAHADAKALYRRALAIQEKALGPDHPDLGLLLSNLANVCLASGDYAEAKALSERALAIQEKALGPDHPSVAASLSILAGIHEREGQSSAAKPLYERALAIREKALGPDHPHVAASLHGLADARRKAGETAAARSLYERALAIREKALGPDHLDVARSLGALGGLALAEGRPAEALPLLERALAIHDAHAGADDGEPACRLELARALVRTGGDRNRAVAEARRAADDFRAAGDGQALAEAEAFLARGGQPRGRARRPP